MGRDQFHVEVRREKDAAIVVVAGELDRSAAAAVDAKLEQVWQSDAELVVFDLRDVEFMDSTGLRSVVLAHRRAQKERRRFGVVEGSDQVRQLLHWSGLLPVLTVVRTPEELLDCLNLRAVADADAIGQLRRDVVAYAERLGAEEELREALRLAISEALTNVVVHAYDEREKGDMIVEARLDDDDHLAVVVCDEGRGLLPTPLRDTRGLGLGLGLMAQMADDFAIANREDQPGTIVSMRFSLARRSSPTPAAQSTS